MRSGLSSNNICYICRKSIESLEEAETCVICGVKMHRRCIDEEILTNAEGSILCPYDVALAALDWFDSILSTYASSFTNKQREEIVERLKTYLNMLSQDIKG